MFSFLLLFPNMINVYLSKFGRDERFKNGKDSDIDMDALQKIKMNFLKLYILESLLDDSIDDVNKINLIDSHIKSDLDNHYSNFNPDLTNGGLYKDFNFLLLNDW
jgi:hypothetical protein